MKWRVEDEEIKNMKASTYKKKIKENMEKLGTYRAQFDKTIEILAQTCEDRDLAREEFEASGGGFVVTHINKNGSSNLVKNPHIALIDKLDEKILQYNRELGLTPAGLKKLNEKLLKVQKSSGLEDVMKGLLDEL